MTVRTQQQQTTASVKERIHCMAILDELPGHQHGVVRKPSVGFAGWLNKMESRLMRRVSPDLSPSSHIRGARVAIDYVLHALLEHSQAAHFSFVVPDQRLAEFQDWAHSRPPGDPAISISPFSTLTGGRFDELSPDIWLNLHGDNHFAFRLRDQLSSHYYPTTTLQHGLSTNSLLYDKFFRSILTPTYSSDSLICTSQVCAQAIAAIFASLTAPFSAQSEYAIGFQGRLDTIPLCVDTDFLIPGDKLMTRSRLNLPLNALVLLYIGYLSQVKAEVAALLPVLARLIANNPSRSIVFLIAGTGPNEYASELEAVVRDLGLMNHVQILREVSDDLKLALMQAADIFLAPCESMQESFGLTPVEAMSCGLPQVAADWSGYRETVQHGTTGFLIPTMWGCSDSELTFTADLLGWDYDHIHQAQSITLDLTALYSSLNELIQNESLRLSMSKASRARAVTHFSPKLLATRYDALWRELVSQGKNTPLARVGNRFDSVHYCEYFSHFASHQLTDDYHLRPGCLATISLDRLMSLSAVSLRGMTLLDRELLTAIMTSVARNFSADRPYTLEAALCDLTTMQKSSNLVRRHVTLLAKFGFIKLVRGDLSNTPNV